MHIIAMESLSKNTANVDSSAAKHPLRYRAPFSETGQKLKKNSCTYRNLCNGGLYDAVSFEHRAV